MSQWLSWRDAISLSSALGDGAAAPSPAARTAVGAEEAECARVRAALAQSIIQDGTRTAAAGRGARAASAPPAGPAVASVDFPPYRQRYLARQQAMEAAVEPVRRRLRAVLAARSPAAGRLAALDAVMEQVLGAQERRLLSTVPALLERHFESLRRAQPVMSEQMDTDGAPDAHPREGPPPGEWLDVFRKDMRALLLAELDLRWQPVEGLLAALRA